MRTYKLLIVLFLVLLFVKNSFAVVVAGGGPGGSMHGAGGSATGGQSIQADEFTGAASYSVTLPVPPARGGIEPQLVLNYSSYKITAATIKIQIRGLAMVGIWTWVQLSALRQRASSTIIMVQTFKRALVDKVKCSLWSMQT